MKEIVTKEYFPYATKIPEALFLLGTLPSPEHKLITIVGTRKPTSYGTRAIKKIISGLEGMPVSIVSGLALGIDTLAHKHALEHHLHTIAIPGSSLNDSELYPRANVKLANEILQRDGALISPWEEQKAAPWTFPERNRIMAAIADLVLVIEASEESGTMITAREAKLRGRPLAAIPGDIDASMSSGANLLLKEGAHCVRSAQDVLELLGIINGTTPKQQKLPLDSTTDPLLLLLIEPVHREELIVRFSRPASETLARIAELELEGKLVIDPSGLIHRI